MTCVISISGNTGAGKTSLTSAVAERLGGAVALHFDDYEYPDAAAIYPDTEGWIANGLPVAMHGATTLADEVARLRAGESIRHPKTGSVIAPTPFLVVEEPFGRGRPAIAPLIDLAVVIATPAAIALARRIGRDLGTTSPDLKTEDLVTQVRNYLGWYATAGHAFYERMVELATVHADLVLDGTRPIDELAQTVVDRATTVRGPL